MTAVHTSVLPWVTAAGCDTCASVLPWLAVALDDTCVSLLPMAGWQLLELTAVSIFLSRLAAAGYDSFTSLLS
jgi:hypothetical protein